MKFSHLAHDELDERLDSWLLRWRLVEAAGWALRGAVAGLGVGLGIALLARMTPLLPVREQLAVATSSAVLGAALGAALRLFWPVTRLDAARYFDRRLGLAERISTAVELAEARVAIGRRHLAEAPDWMVRRQRDDALARARAVDPASALPFRVGYRDPLVVLALMAGIGLALFAPNPMQSLLERQKAVDAAVQEQVTQIESLQEAVEADESLSEEQKENLQAPLEEALRRLEEGRLTPEQAVSILTNAESQLQSLANPAALEQAQGLQEAGETLSQTTTGPLAPVSEELASGDLRGAAEELASLDPARMTVAERQALADQLEQAALNLANTNPELAEQLEAAANSLRGADAEGAAQALQQAAQTLQQAAGDIAQAQAAQSAANQLAQGRQQVAQAGQGSSQGAAERIAQGQGQGQSQDSGPTEGQGSGGAGRGEGSGEAQGGEAGQDPISQGNNPGDGGERSFEEIFSPYRLGGEGGEQVDLGSSGQPGDVVGQADSSPGADGQATVPYNEVYSLYQQAATEAINSGRIPIGLRPVVRNYFSSLQP